MGGGDVYATGRTHWLVYPSWCYRRIFNILPWRCARFGRFQKIDELPSDQQKSG